MSKALGLILLSSLRAITPDKSSSRSGRRRTPLSLDQLSRILRTSLSGSSIIRQLLSKTIVLPRAGSNGSPVNPK